MRPRSGGGPAIEQSGAERAVVEAQHQRVVGQFAQPGGKTIRSIIESTGCKIDVEDSGKVSIASSDEAAAMRAIEIIEGLRGHTTGYAVPTYVIDAPGGGGKIPVMPNYLISYSDHKVVLRNYEGYITTYEEPETYQKHDSLTCRYCQHERPEPGQSGDRKSVV